MVGDFIQMKTLVTLLASSSQRRRMRARQWRIKFATPTDARKTVSKVKKISKPFARKIQILTVGEQRAKVMGKKQVAAIFKKGKDAIRRANNRKT